MHKKTYKVTVVLQKDLIVLVVVVVVDKTSGFKLQSNLHWWPPLHNGRLSTTATYVCHGGQSIQCFLFKPLYNGNLSTKAMATKARPQQPVFSETDEKVKNRHEIWFVWCFDD